jgi:deoxyribodipyrimidine photo-lyase
MSVAIALFTRDLRVNDNPVLYGACHAATEVVPLFVLDTAILRNRLMSPNRAAFLADALVDLDAQLAQLGGNLVVRCGDVAKEVERLVADLGAGELHLAADVSGYSQCREQALREHLASHSRLQVHTSTITVVEPGAIAPAGGGTHFAVFTPYYRRWLHARRRDLVEVPRRITVPPVGTAPLPSAEELCPGQRSPHLPRGGEAVGRGILSDWLAGPIGDYQRLHDDLAVDGTSRLSPYLHFGRRSATTLPVTTFAATYPSSRASPAPRYTNPGSSIRIAGRAWITPNPSSTFVTARSASTPPGAGTGASDDH